MGDKTNGMKSKAVGKQSRQRIFLALCSVIISFKVAAQTSPSEDELRCEMSAGLAYSVPILHLASMDMSRDGSGMAYQKRPGVCMQMALSARDDLWFGFHYEGQRYETDMKFVQYHMQDDWSKIAHKSWTRGRAKTFWSADVLGLTASKQYFLTKKKYLSFQMGALLGYASLTSPEFQLNADFDYYNPWPIFPWFGYSTPQTSLKVYRKYANGIAGGINSRFTVIIKKQFLVSVGGDVKFTRANFKQVRFDFRDNTDATNPGKVSNFSTTRNFHQSFLTSGVNMTLGILLDTGVGIE